MADNFISRFSIMDSGSASFLSLFVHGFHTVFQTICLHCFHKKGNEK